MDNLLRDLQHAWATDGDSPEARTAIRRWACARPDLAAYDSPSQLVGAANSRRDARAATLVDDLTEEASSDPWAARTVLQALLPGLARLIRRHRDLVGAGEPFASLAELDDFVVCTAFERITEVAADVPRFRLNTVLDSTWTRLRSHAAGHRRERSTRVSLAEALDRPAAPSRSDAEELALALVDAVQRGLLRPADAGLVYTTRVAGAAPAAVAQTLACRTASLLRRRHRVEQLLAAEALGEARPANCYVGCR